MALEMLDVISQINTPSGEPLRMRVGINTGPVIAGVIGAKKFIYDLWGDTVNTAARMETHSEPGRINISATTYKCLSESFHCTYRGKIDAKNKGKIDMYYLDEIKPALQKYFLKN